HPLTRLVLTDHDRHKQRGCFSGVEPRVIGASLHHRIKWLERNGVALIENERDFAREKEDIVDRRRHMHEWMTCCVTTRSWPSNVFEEFISNGFDLIRRSRRIRRWNRKQTKLRSAGFGKKLEGRTAA